MVRNTSRVVSVPYQIRPTSNRVSGDVVVVKATGDISIQAINKEPYNLDVWTVYPVDTLGNDYLVITHTMMPFFQIITAYPGNNVIVSKRINADRVTMHLSHLYLVIRPC